MKLLLENYVKRKRKTLLNVRTLKRYGPPLDKIAYRSEIDAIKKERLKHEQ